MSRLDKFEDILKSYEGKTQKPELNYGMIPFGLIKQKLCEGMNELDCRLGLLIGKSGKYGAENLDVFVPKQNSSPVNTIIDDWDKAFAQAKKTGDLVGMAFYSGKSEPHIRDTLLTVHNMFCQKYGMKDFFFSINAENKFIYTANGELYESK